MILNVPYYLQYIKWAIPAAFMFGTAPTYFVVWGGWRVITLLLPTRIYEAGDEFLYSMYQRMVLFFFENCSGVEVSKIKLAKGFSTGSIVNHP